MIFIVLNNRLSVLAAALHEGQEVLAVGVLHGGAWTHAAVRRGRPAQHEVVVICCSMCYGLLV